MIKENIPRELLPILDAVGSATDWAELTTPLVPIMWHSPGTPSIDEIEFASIDVPDRDLVSISRR